MAKLEALICDQAGCPLAAEGRCLEGFDNPAECPHSRPGDEESYEAYNRVILQENVTPQLPSRTTTDVLPEGLPPSPSRQMINIGGDQALEPGTASLLTAARDCALVLVAGEYEAGKTTLVVEIYASFLDGPFAGFEFSGSHTLRALDTLHRPARSSSGRADPVTERTQEGLGLLHLSVRNAESAADLLFTDIRGELFESVINGRPVREDLPLAQRADVCIVAFDGEKMRSPAGRKMSEIRGKQLLGGLSDVGAIRNGTPTLIVATKMDLLDKANRKDAESVINALADFATSRGLDGESLMVSARNGAENLDEVLRFAVRRRRQVSSLERVNAPAPDRIFWRSW